jgi:hypothetical protein
MANFNAQLDEMEKGQARPEASLPQAITGLTSPTWESNDETLTSPHSMYRLRISAFPECATAH